MAPEHLAGPHKEKIEHFLQQPLMAHLATCNPQTLQPHTVPVWFEWDGKQVWISSFRSTRKVREILVNPLVSLVVDSDSPGEPAIGVLFEGAAQLLDDPAQGIERGGSIYARYLGVEGAQAEEPQSWLHDPEHLLICLEPRKVYAWGFD
jgi:nitroimidazol reductase NimA-like FMN-containing flavoprotein (pyridoxamine 5'-phosphate oxidase superfamily)